MSEKEKQAVYEDTEEFVRDLLMKVPKGEARKQVLVATGIASAMVTAQALTQNRNGSASSIT